MDQHKIEKVGGKRVIPQDKSLTTIYLPYARIVGQCLSILVPIMGEWKIMEMYTNYSPLFSCSFGLLKSSDISII
jgi:hypothetical protein